MTHPATIGALEVALLGARAPVPPWRCGRCRGMLRWYERGFGAHYDCMDPQPSVDTIGLVACSATKLAWAAPARDLYQGQLFRAARAFAEKHCDRWYILSAMHGVLEPAQVVEPYDLSLEEVQAEGRGKVLSPAPLDLWAIRCRTALMASGDHWRDQNMNIHYGPPRVNLWDRVVMLAPALYAERLGELLTAWGARVERPLKGMFIGHQKAWLARAQASIAPPGRRGIQ